MAIGVGEGKSLTDLLEPDSATTLVVFRFGVIAIGASKYDLIVGIYVKVDMDERRLSGGNAMFERILNKRNENQWGDAHLSVVRCVKVNLKVYVLTDAQTHELDVIV